MRRPGRDGVVARFLPKRGKALAWALPLVAAVAATSFLVVVVAGGSADVDGDSTRERSEVRLYEIAHDDGYSGRFWLQYSGTARRPGLRLPLKPSLAWARKHAAVVVVEVGGKRFSAGRQAVEAFLNGMTP